MQPMVFETAHLLVRPLRPDDFPPFFEMQGNPNVLRYTLRPVDTEEQARQALDHAIACYAKPGNDWWIWAVARKQDEAFVGTCAVVGPEGEIGYRFLEKYWGLGYASEICDPLLEHALGEMGLPSVLAQVVVENIASIKVLEKSKMAFVKEYFNEKEGCTDRVYRLGKRPS